MTSFIFIKKELKEIIRSKKVFILPAVFLFFGFLSPLTARYINEIIKSFSVGIQFNIPPPTYIDAFAQLVKNLTQMVIIIVLLSFAGVVVEERIKGTMTLVLTKPLSRRTFIFSKLMSAATLLTFSYVLSIIGFLYYTWILFPGFPTNNIAIGFLLVWLYMLFFVSLSVFASTISRSYTISAVISFSIFVLMSILVNIQSIVEYNPVYLALSFVDLVAGLRSFGDLTLTTIITCLFIIILNVASSEIFRRQEI